MLKHKVAIVTGASSGIGLETARMLFKEGCTVIMISKTYEKVKKASAELSGDKTFPFGIDVGNEAQVKDAIKKIIQEFKHIDILINNAGIYNTRNIDELNIKEFEEMMQTNFMGTVNMTRYVFPHLIKQKSGTIINISSGLGKRGVEGNAAYCSSKWAMMGFSECLELEAKEHGINVSVVCPGQTNTPIFDSIKDEKYKQKMLKPKDVADAILYLCKLPSSVKIKEISIRPDM